MRDEKHPVMSGLILDETTTLTLDELSCACSVRVERIIELVDEGILEPVGRELTEWCFPGPSLGRARIAMHLQRDLDINLAGVALVLDLMDELESLRARLRRLEQGNRSAEPQDS
jgi:chaperone modulatory protein CbpM